MNLSNLIQNYISVFKSDELFSGKVIIEGYPGGKSDFIDNETLVFTLYSAEFASEESFAVIKIDLLEPMANSETDALKTLESVKNKIFSDEVKADNFTSGRMKYSSELNCKSISAKFKVKI